MLQLCFPDDEVVDYMHRSFGIFVSVMENEFFGGYLALSYLNRWTKLTRTIVLK